MAAFSEGEMRSRIPVIVILGATGSGKSKLGIEIARKFAGEILSADSMQVYKGLDIITNKVTAEERLLAPHHLLDIVEPLQRFTVVDFRNRALPVIEKLMQDGKLPVIVGGTNYYIESLLWKVLVENPVKQMKLPGDDEETHSDGSSDGGTLKEHVADNTESLSVKQIVLDGNSCGDKLQDVTCQNEDLDKRSFVSKCGKRALDCGDEVQNIKCQACGVGLKPFDTGCQIKVHSEERQAQDGQEVNCVLEGPNLKSTECHKEVDCRSSDSTETQNSVFCEKNDIELTRNENIEEGIDRGGDMPKPVIQSQSHSGNVGRDHVDESRSMLREKSLDGCPVGSAELSSMRTNVKVCCKTEVMEEVESVTNEQVVSLHNKNPEIEVDTELVYERDRKRMLEALNDENTESKKLRVQGVTVDLMDEAALEHLPSPQLYERLQAVDPDMAQSLHPNNKRKIIRSLQVYAQTGRTHSSILREQRSADGGSELGGPLRFPHSCILWLQCDQVLDERLDVRVDTMLEQGLVQELLDFHRRYNKERLATSTEADYTKGIFQSIGFKEFHEYLVLSEEDRDSEKGSKLFHVGVDALKLVTRRYARRQLRWITNRFLCRPSRQVPPVYGLDATDPNLWNEHVLGPALQIVESYLKGWAPAGIDPLPVTERSVKNDLKIHHCDVCDRMFIGDIQWNDHLHSKKHRRMLQRKQLHKD
ncbi:tRNA dimethylallyltransferase, mitochondrial isoform X2 [Zootermopsis nevadensis]|uniref:tRNA dimethylallyltransferase, mitochondrial isoform X2 n=1 Tax=Zootermopsis nevadensis TaxID=136037 RepID=UPI000B8EAA25|nr:tRNA dimethylallyltransferase, mitochondrial isoform X2 [Zootermopsis nevadensis]